ncbi:hypothetical protein NQ314_016418 [Rhamnusium bicolor]|uniref:HMG box domain-containing protein n=1 Tax=Rhamnusium bicolor TaxID=1586634 RepID=A0AAV8WYP1_9CUCU|nr:hypothetical protein NQ314_016418 [Rhamnusium bicolor]
MNSSGLQIKIKPDSKIDGETADEANNLLRNGILVETSKGLICMSLNDALSSDLNLSVDDLRNVAAQLISQQNVVGNKDRIALGIAQTNINCDSDGFSSECSDISTTTSGSSVQSAFITFSSLSNEIQTNIFNCENQIQSIINRPKIVSISNLAFDKTVSINNSNVSVTEKTDAPNIKLQSSEVGTKITCIDTSIKAEIKAENTEGSINQIPIISKTISEVSKPKKGRAPATGYNLYLNEQRKLFKDSTLAFHEITKIVGNRWSSLTLEEKKPYLAKAEEDKKRYREELKQYRQSDAYRAYLSKKRKKRLQNNVLSESDMDATDDFDEEDNEELYCRTCDQWFHNLHNKREHLQGKQHLQSVAGDITRELGSDIEGFGTTSTVSFSTSLDESSLDGMPNLKNATDTKNCTNSSSVYDAMANLAAIVSKRETEINILQNRQQESISQQQALCSQLLQLNEREKKLQRDLLQLKENEKNMENQVFHLWQLPSWFIITDFNSYATTADFNEGTD